MTLVDLGDIRAAAGRLGGVAVRTPLLPCLAGPWADERTLHVKPENLQPVGAFKIRGAFHAIAALPPGRRAGGVVTDSSGNHGRAVAYAARLHGVKAVVVMPDTAPAVKVEAVRALGAEIVTVRPAERQAASARLVDEHGYAYIPPYDHRDVIAGQGTVGLEIAQDLPEVDLVLTPVGGGGLISGVAVALKALVPGVRVVGVEPELAADAQESLRLGRLETWSTERRYRTVADALRTPLSELTWAHVRTHVDDIVTVTEEQILDTVAVLARSARIVAEPGGAVAVAAYLHRGEALPAVRRSVAVVSGGNVEPALLAELLAR